MLLLARYAHSGAINLTYVKLAFPLFQCQIAACKTCIKFKFCPGEEKGTCTQYLSNLTKHPTQ